MLSRRGRPSAHKKFGEATAILAADWLHAAAFKLVSDPELIERPATRAALADTLALASMVVASGQAADLDIIHDRFHVDKERTINDTERLLQSNHAQKTGALFAATGLLGLFAENTSSIALLKDAQSFGMEAGIAFQLADDLADFAKGETHRANCAARFSPESTFRLINIKLKNARGHLSPYVDKASAFYKFIDHIAASSMAAYKTIDSATRAPP